VSERWPSEPAPAKDALYRWVHQQWFNKAGEVSPTFFRNARDPETGREGGMSTDWSRYSTPQETRERAKDPAINGVIEMTVGDVLAIPTTPKQKVLHTPIQNHPNPEIKDNRAHTDVLGPKDDNEIKRLFSRISRTVISAPARGG
jgi:hypothetical protein